MKKLLSALLIFCLTIGIVGCGLNTITDTRIIGTWQSDATGARCVFRENGTAEIFSSVNERKYHTEDGLIILDYGKFGTDSLSYDFAYGATANGETVEYLVIEGVYYKKVSN